MSTETVQAGKSPLLDTSHLKVKFPLKQNMEILLVENLLSPYQESILIM